MSQKRFHLDQIAPDLDRYAKLSLARCLWSGRDGQLLFGRTWFAVAIFTLHHGTVSAHACEQDHIIFKAPLGLCPALS
jgi:hypothetical protein